MDNWFSNILTIDSTRITKIFLTLSELLPGNSILNHHSDHKTKHVSLISTLPILTVILILSTCVHIITVEKKQENFAHAQASDFNFAAAGDWGCTSNTQNTVSNIVDKSAELVLALGDLSYQTTADCWFSIVDPVINRMKIAIGNHDDESSFLLNQYMSKFGISKQWYSNNYQNTHFLSISTEQPYSLGSEQYDFIRNDLQEASINPNIKWIVTFLHKPAYTSPAGSSHPPIASIADQLHPLFDQYGVDLVLQGHNHNYGRSYQLKYSGDGGNPIIVDENANTYSERVGQVWAVVGTGGQSYYSFSDHSGYIAKEFTSTFGVLNIDVTDTSLVGTYYGNDGSVKDQFTITKSDTPAPTAPPGPSTIDQQRALQFIKNSYNSQVGLLSEAPCCDVYWLWNDNLLGQIALKHIYPELAAQVEAKMNSFDVPMRTPWATLDPQYRNSFSVGGSSEPTISTSPFVIRYSDYGGSNTLWCNNYADIAFLSAIHYFYLGNNELAKMCYDAGKSTWDGTGMKDSGSITGDYAVYKTALGLLAQKITGFDPIGIPSDYFSRFQSSNGGITTDIIGGQPSGSQNIETTAAVLFALNPSLLQEPTPVPTPTPTPVPAYHYEPYLTLSGSNSQDTLSSSSLQLSQFSVAAWFKTTNNFGSNAYIVNKGGSGSDSSGRNMNYGIWMTGSESIGAGFETRSGSDIIATTPVSYNDGKWHYVVVTYGGSTVRIYFDGVQVATKSTSGAIPDNTGTQPVRVGANSLALNGYFTGNVDEVRIWNRALTTQEVSDAYNDGIFVINGQVLYSNFD